MKKSSYCSKATEIAVFSFTNNTMKSVVLMISATLFFCLIVDFARCRSGVFAAENDFQVNREILLPKIVRLHSKKETISLLDAYEDIQKGRKRMPSFIHDIPRKVDIGSDEFLLFDGLFVLRNGVPFFQSPPEEISVEQSVSQFTSNYIIKQKIPTNGLRKIYPVYSSLFGRIRSFMVKSPSNDWEGQKLIVDNATNWTYEISVDSFPPVRLSPRSHLSVYFLTEEDGTVLHEIALKNVNTHHQRSVRLKVPMKYICIYNVAKANRYFGFEVFYVEK